MKHYTRQQIETILRLAKALKRGIITTEEYFAKACDDSEILKEDAEWFLSIA